MSEKRGSLWWEQGRFSPDAMRARKAGSIYRTLFPGIDDSQLPCPWRIQLGGESVHTVSRSRSDGKS